MPQWHRARARDTRGTTRSILMVEQSAVKALEISDYAYVLELGRTASMAPARPSGATKGSAARIWSVDLP